MSELKYKSSEVIGMVLSAVVAFAAVATPLSCSMNDNATMEAMVKAGSHPIDAQCAVKPNSNRESCAMRAVRSLEMK